jgi:hypothetical protein
MSNPVQLHPSFILRQHGFDARGLTAASQGLNNAVWLTDAHVLRISKGVNVNHEREARIALHALSIGIRTARPLHWERGYSIWERLPGDSAREPQPPVVWHELLNDLERLRADPPEARPNLETWVQVPFPWDRTPSPPGVWDTDPRALETDFAAQFTHAERSQMLELLRPRRIAHLEFLHADAFAANIQASNGEYVGLIDWGNAQWHCLEREFSWMEDGALEVALQRYDLDVPLLYAMRLELFLKVGQYGFTTSEHVRHILERVKQRQG